ncbi:oxygenase MpaB family protein [Robertkochia flava]|uniref:oxygenase MpaB family protein n=1 Tax=Robertkochia flava TaxID=3447986 RepID=UPI001CCEE86A|nr:oxygenase MpaB family protein [Robertkochia marina]
MEYFVKEGSIVRSIWGDGDTVLLIFAGAAAEFALNKAVDWLYFTGKLPADPLGRLFSTVSYAREIVFSDEASALKAISRINQIHGSVERMRQSEIPQWAYRDVLFMLVDYSIRAYEVMHRKLNYSEKEEVFQVFYRVGLGMHIAALPLNFSTWEEARKEHLLSDLEYSTYTADLYSQYEKHLGPLRFRLLKEAQKILVPKRMATLLGFNSIPLLRPALTCYIFLKKHGYATPLKTVIIPGAYREKVRSLDHHRG